MKFLLSFKGRISRSQYWLQFTLPYILILCLATFIDVAMAGGKHQTVGLFTVLVWLLSIWPSFAVAAKRCHDHDRSGWWLLISLIPIVGPLWLLIELGFLRGTIGANRFGPDPIAA